MDEKDLLGLYPKYIAPYSYMDFPRLVSSEPNSYMDALAEMTTKLMADVDKKTTQSGLEKLLAKKELSVAETLDLYNRGLKPYFYSHNANTLVELTLENENDRTTSIKWIHPKIAEKIQTRYQEMDDLVQKKGAAIREIDSQIEDLKLRISMIEESGTDLII